MRSSNKTTAAKNETAEVIKNSSSQLPRWQTEERKLACTFSEHTSVRVCFLRGSESLVRWTNQPTDRSANRSRL